MVNWGVTASRVYCDEAGSDVTIMVYKDWSAKCSFYDNESVPKRQMGKCGRLSGKSQICPRMKSYIDKLLEEEKL